MHPRIARSSTPSPAQQRSSSSESTTSLPADLHRHERSPRDELQARLSRSLESLGSLDSESTLSAAQRATVDDIRRNLEDDLVATAIDAARAEQAEPDAIAQLERARDAVLRGGDIPRGGPDWVDSLADRAAEALTDAARQAAAPLDEAQRRAVVDRSILETLASWKNSPDAARRWGSRAATVLRTLTIVAATTAARQAIGYLMQVVMDGRIGGWRLPPAARAAVLMMVMAAPFLLNIGAAIVERHTGRETDNSRFGRTLMGGVHLGGAAALGVGALSGMNMTAAAAHFTQFFSYVVLRDMLQLLAPLGGDAKPNAAGTALAAGTYVLMQTVAGALMDHFAPQSGAGYAAAAFARQLKALGDSPTVEQIKAASDAIEWKPLQDLTRGLINGAVEAADDWNFYAWGKAMSNDPGAYSEPGLRPRLPEQGRDGAVTLLQKVSTRGSAVGAVNAGASAMSHGFPMPDLGPLGAVGITSYRLLENFLTAAWMGATYTPFSYSLDSQGRSHQPLPSEGPMDDVEMQHLAPPEVEDNDATAPKPDASRPR